MINKKKKRNFIKEYCEYYRLTRAVNHVIFTLLGKTQTWASYSHLLYCRSYLSHSCNADYLFFYSSFMSSLSATIYCIMGGKND